MFFNPMQEFSYMKKITIDYLQNFSSGISACTIPHFGQLIKLYYLTEPFYNSKELNTSSFEKK